MPDFSRIIRMAYLRILDREPDPGGLASYDGQMNGGMTEAAMRAFAEASNLKLGAVAQPLRVALTGRTTSPGIFNVLAVLGREESLARLADQASA